MRLLVILVWFALHRRTPPDGPGKPPDGNGDGDGKPSQQHGSINAGENVSNAQDAIGTARDRGKPAEIPGSTSESRPGGGQQPGDPAEPPPGVTFDDPKRPNLGSDGKYYIRDGVDHDVPIDDPTDLSRTITDIDRPESGVLWEEKSAVNATDVDKWVNKQVIKKTEAYIAARQHIAGRENAPVGIDFTSPNPDPAFKAAVEKAIADLRVKYPDVTILVKWAE
ncbi:hypothetical protein [Kibdelosporangium aridum]|uniref:Uncharacterized protein n=1 Tax=Kibdelosporangium aridum TaxID=2030 RepID=A0A1Y5XMK7_KIBAR|nr:hypothetical protein [Kibdelosporangium aridum]SMC98191.1 hypothetical protein SAMN05661093_03512 [Kibdelosporangium aridum]